MIGPLSSVLAKLGLGQPVTILGLGDSTMYGAGDSSVPQAGIGRLGILLGQSYGYNVQLTLFHHDTGALSNEGVIYTSGLGAPTITVQNSGIPGQQIYNDMQYLAAYPSTYLNTAADVIIIATGFNEGAESNDIAWFQTGIIEMNGILQTTIPGVPIIWTTENPSTPGSYLGQPAMIAGMLTTLIGDSTMPMSPPLQASITYPGVWALDTKQPYNLSGIPIANLLADGVHPNAAGYALQASWMFTELATGSTAPASAVITTTLGTPGGIPTGSGGLTLPANWKAGDVFTAQAENNVAGALNLLIADIATLGYSLSTVEADWAPGSVWTAGNAGAVVAAINSLNAAVSARGGPSLKDVPVPPPAWTADSQNMAETAINQLHAAVTALTGGG